MNEENQQNIDKPESENMNFLIRNAFKVSETNNYLIAGNICNAFAIGEVGSVDDFFLIGSEPKPDSNYPMLTGNVLDSDGNVLFRLVQNHLVINPGKCSKILSDRVGYEIHDGNDQLILKVTTEFKELPNSNTECWVTTLTANFYNKNGELVFVANSGNPDEKIKTNCKVLFGMDRKGLVGLSMYDEAGLTLARIAVSTQGKINEVLTGTHREAEIDLDGKILRNVSLERCRVKIASGDFVLVDNVNIVGCHFNLLDSADRLFGFFKINGLFKDPTFLGQDNPNK